MEDESEVCHSHVDRSPQHGGNTAVRAANVQKHISCVTEESMKHLQETGKVGKIAVIGISASDGR